MRISTLIFSLLILGAIITAGAWYMTQLPVPEKDSQVGGLRLVKTPELKLTTTVLIEENGRRQLITCRQHTCHPELMPPSAEGDPVFDGEAWYRYEDTEKRKLQHFDSREQSGPAGQISGQTIVEETQFVRPRDLFISPTGKQVAYWLDNIREPQKRLTELWVYDSSRGSTHLIAEQIKQDNVASAVRWNRAGTHLWFIYQTEDIKQLRLFSTSPAAEVTAPKSADPEKLLDVDITGEKLASTGVYAEWLPDGQLLYITQQADTFTVERKAESAAETLITLPGFFRSAHTDPTGEAIIIVSTQPPARPEVQTIYLKTGQSIDRFNLPTSASNIKVVLVASETPAATAETVPAKSLEDAELVAFIEKYLPRIVSATEPKATRLILTDQPNTLFVEYHTSETSQRSLVTIRDALHPEWSLRALYTSQQGQWVKTEGSRLPDPTPTRIYEWEDSLKQWIRKN